MISARPPLPTRVAIAHDALGHPLRFLELRPGTVVTFGYCRTCGFPQDVADWKEVVV